jgi:hypothetical protein
MHDYTLDVYYTMITPHMMSCWFDLAIRKIAEIAAIERARMFYMRCTVDIIPLLRKAAPSHASQIRIEPRLYDYIDFSVSAGPLIQLLVLLCCAG